MACELVLFKAFVTGTDAKGLINTVSHIGLKESVSSQIFYTFQISIVWEGLFLGDILGFMNFSTARYRKGFEGILLDLKN